MTQQQTNEYNERCAKFLDKEYLHNRIVSTNTHFSEQNPSGKIWEECKFHTDWNWIMEVVEAIENSSEDINVLFFPQGCAIGRISVDANTKKQAVIEAINQFLIWNEQQTTL